MLACCYRRADMVGVADYISSSYRCVTMTQSQADIAALVVATDSMKMDQVCPHCGLTPEQGPAAALEAKAAPEGAPFYVERPDGTLSLTDAGIAAMDRALIASSKPVSTTAPEVTEEMVERGAQALSNHLNRSTMTMSGPAKALKHHKDYARVVITAALQPEGKGR